MPELITFTGIDERTSRDGVLELARRRHGIEWAMLVGSATGQEPRFPPLATIDAWRDFAADHRLRTALHLCGRYSRDVAAGRGREHLALCAGFSRVQVNLPAAERHARIGAIIEFQQALGVPVILQHDGGWDSVPRGTTASSTCSTGRVGEESHRTGCANTGRSRARRRPPVRLRRRNPDRERARGVRVRTAARRGLPHLARHGDAHPDRQPPRPRQGRENLQTPIDARQVRTRQVTITRRSRRHGNGQQR